MDHTALVCVCETGTDLFEIEKRALNRQRTRVGEREHVAARKILEHDVMKRCACEIDRGSVTQSIYYVWMTNAIECYCFVLKIVNKCSFELRVGCVLQV